MNSKIILLFSVLTVFALLAVTAIPSVSAMNAEPMYLHPEEPIDPLVPITQPVCTHWHELYPVFCNYYHLSDWNDNDDGVLSPCDYIDMTDESGDVAWYHVDEVTVTIFVSPPEGEPMYLEFEGGYENISIAIHEPVCTLWHEVHPVFCNSYHLSDWMDNDDGYLSYCDTIFLENLNTGKKRKYHVEEVTIDIIVTEMPEMPDLVVEKFVTIEDGTFTVSYGVTNIGNAPAGASTTCKFVDGVRMESQFCPPLVPDESYSGRFDPEPCPCGKILNVTVCADNDDEVVESNETNNCEVNIVRCPPGIPGIEVNKTVWNGTAWVDRITANVSDTVRFRCEMHNNGTCCPLTGFVVTDILSDSLEYKDNATVHFPNCTTEHIEPIIVEDRYVWEFLDLVLVPCETLTIEFDAHVIKCGVDVNIQTVTAVCAEEPGLLVSDEDTATVVVPPKPGIEVNKTVWNGTAWVDRITANVSDTVRFRCEMHNNGTCCPLTNLTVTDILSESLEYADNATVHFPNCTTVTMEPDIVDGTYVWEFPYLVLEPCETLTIEFDAHVVQYGEDWNKQNATAEGCGESVYDEDYAYVTVLPKPDLVITGKWVCWPDNCTICYNVTNIGNGTAPACHNTTLYVDGVVVAHDHVPVNLATNESYIGCFDNYSWTYTSPRDNITVCADNNKTVDEVNETNNCLTNIWMCGDVNADGKVTMSDVRKVFNRYLDPSYPLDLPWAADVNCDGKVSMSDVRKVFNRYLDPSYGLNCCCEGNG